MKQLAESKEVYVKLSSKKTTSGIPVGADILYNNKNAKLNGIGYDPKGEICIIRVEDGPKLEVRVDEIERK